MNNFRFLERTKTFRIIFPIFIFSIVVADDRSNKISQKNLSLKLLFIESSIFPGFFSGSKISLNFFQISVIFVPIQESYSINRKGI